MRTPECLAPLLDQGIIQEIIRPVMSGKEAQIYLVVSGGELRVAKIYKEAQHRSFRQRAEYTEGRAVRSSRTQRAMNRRSRFGREQDESGWRSTEVDVIYRLRAAGVRVPEPHYYGDGVLVMELIADAQGAPAPRLSDVRPGPTQAREIFETLLPEVVKMLSAGVVHGDLSEFNVLLGQSGPVLIDFPQAVDPAHNQNARKLLIRDVDNLSLFLSRAVPGQRRLPYGQELWELYTRNELSPQTILTGRYEPPRREVDESAVLYEIDAAAREAARRSIGLDSPTGRKRRKKAQAAPQASAAVAPPGRPATSARPASPGTGGRGAPPRTGDRNAPPGTGGRNASPGTGGRNASPGTGDRGAPSTSTQRGQSSSMPPRTDRPQSGAPSGAAPKPGESPAHGGAPQTNPTPKNAARRRRRRRRRAANPANAINAAPPNG